MLKWEYNVVDLIKEVDKESTGGLLGYWIQTADLEKALNKLGAEGWELVYLQFDKQETIIVGFFKRPC